MQSETFKIKFLHLNIERRLFRIDSVSTRIATSSRGKNFTKLSLLTGANYLNFSKREEALGSDSERTTKDNIHQWDICMTSRRRCNEQVATGCTFICLSCVRMMPKVFHIEPQRLKITSQLLWYWFCSLFLLCRQNKTNANMASASLHLFRDKCCRVFTLSYFCVLFVVSFIARSPFRHKRPREQLTVKEWSLS